MPVVFTNNATAPLASSISSSTTSITVTTGQGALFPATSASNYFYATLTDSSNNLEVIKVTSRTSDTFTVVRAQEGTTARAYAAADKLEVRVTAAGLTNMAQLDKDNAFTGANSFSGVTTTTAAINTTGTITATAFAGPITGNVTGNVTGNLTGNVTGNTSGTAGSVSTTNWTITESCTKIYFTYGGVKKAMLDSSGNLTVVGNVTGYGTVT